MKRINLFVAIGSCALAFLAIFLIAADHIDAPDVTGTKTDIADFYAFEGDDSSKTVFIATLQGLLTPGVVTENAQFDEDVMIEFNIDNTGDFVEDLVIQAVKRGDSMYFFGPVAPTETGLSSIVETSAGYKSIKISTSSDVQVATDNGINFFAGPRRDAFYFDYNRFNQVASGEAAPEGFLPPEEAADFFFDLNVLAIAIEVPNSMLGTAPTHIGGTVGIDGLPPAYNVWVSTKRKQ